MDYYKQIGQRIRDARHRKEISIEKLAGLLDVSARYISGIESGQMPILLEHLSKISECLEVSTDYILSGKKDDGVQELNRLMEKLSEEQKKEVIKLLQMLGNMAK